MDTVSLMRKPTAFLPLACSTVALSLVLGYLALYGPATQADEGAAARLFQLLLLIQVPLIGYFALVWLPRAPRAALQVLLLQLFGVAAALGLIFYLEW